MAKKKKTGKKSEKRKSAKGLKPKVVAKGEVCDVC